MIVVTTVPQSVARGIVRSGSITLPAGTVADSRPRNAHKVSVAVAIGLPVGLIAGFFGGWIDDVISRDELVALSDGYKVATGQGSGGKS